MSKASPLPHFFARYNLAIEDAEKLAAGTHVVDRIVGRDLKIKRLDINQVLKTCDDLHQGKTVKIQELQHPNTSDKGVFQCDNAITKGFKNG